jgi:hypothetical protein
VDLFLMVEGSNRWIPPPMTVGMVAAHKARRTAAQRGSTHKEDEPLSELQRERFEGMLRTLSVEREQICAAMAFAMDNAESGARQLQRPGADCRVHVHCRSTCVQQLAQALLPTMLLLQHALDPCSLLCPTPTLDCRVLGLLACSHRGG